MDDRERIHQTTRITQALAEVDPILYTSNAPYKHSVDLLGRMMPLMLEALARIAAETQAQIQEQIRLAREAMPQAYFDRNGNLQLLEDDRLEFKPGGVVEPGRSTAPERIVPVSEDPDLPEPMKPTLNLLDDGSGS